jgi:hypothetical protein
MDEKSQISSNNAVFQIADSQRAVCQNGDLCD